MSLRECILYARVSSREQKEGYSIDAQVRLLRDYAMKLGLKIVAEFIDVESAANPGRKNFGEMVKFFKRRSTCRILLVEKVDRLYRNKRDPITIEDLDIEVHFVKDNEIISKESRSGTKFIHDIRIAMARNYSANLSEEVIKGMLEKCRQGYYPFNPPHGYMVDKVTGLLVLHPEKSKFVRMAFELYATGLYSLKTLKKELHLKTQTDLSTSALERILKDRFYIGTFEWRDETFTGKHPQFIDAELFAKVQAVFKSANRPKGCHQDIAFRGLIRCQICGCMITGERKKGRYVYYRCTYGHGRCELPRFREEEIGARLSEAIAAIRMPKDVTQMIETALRAEQDQTQSHIDAERARLTKELNSLQTQRDEAYTDKLRGEITVEFWRARQAKWAEEEVAIKAQLSSLEDEKTPLRFDNLHFTLELAQAIDSKLVTANEFEKADLVKIVLSNSKIDAVSLYPTYRKPFDLIVRRAKKRRMVGETPFAHVAQGGIPGLHQVRMMLDAARAGNGCQVPNTPLSAPLTAWFRSSIATPVESVLAPDVQRTLDRPASSTGMLTTSKECRDANINQDLANHVLSSGSNGIVYPGVRNPAGTSIVCFRPALIWNLRRSAPYKLSIRSGISG